MKAEDIKKIGVVGAGVMGGGIAQTAILSGYKVVLRDLTDEILGKAKNRITDGRYGFKGGVTRGKITQQQMDKAMANLSLTTKVEDVKDCDLIIEAIGGSRPDEIENKDLKRKLFRELDKLVKKDAIFASNTSALTIADMAEVTQRKDKFIGMHWFSPANIMKLVEITYTKDTSEETIKAVEDISKRFGKTTVRVKDLPGDPGFVTTRMITVVRREADRMVKDGIASPKDIDTALKLGFNWPVGPFEMGSGVRDNWS